MHNAQYHADVPDVPFQIVRQLKSKALKLKAHRACAPHIAWFILLVSFTETLLVVPVSICDRFVGLEGVNYRCFLVFVGTMGHYSP